MDERRGTLALHVGFPNCRAEVTLERGASEPTWLLGGLGRVALGAEGFELLRPEARAEGRDVVPFEITLRTAERAGMSKLFE